MPDESGLLPFSKYSSMRASRRSGFKSSSASKISPPRAASLSARNRCSRFWPKGEYEPGRSQSSFDKQYVRDYLLTLDWDKTYPGPELPVEVVTKTYEKYSQAYELLIATRPTAVNLRWALDAMRHALIERPPRGHRPRRRSATTMSPPAKRSVATASA